MMQSWTRAVLIAVFAWNIFQANSAMAGLITLYTGAGLPSDQAWLAYADNTFITGGNASQSAVPNGVRLQADTISSAGYSNRFPNGLSKNPLFPTLDRQLGFSLQFDLQMLAESHLNNDRAGFSVTLIGSDRRGIELGFWTDQIWAQNDQPLFTHGEPRLSRQPVATDTISMCWAISTRSVIGFDDSQRSSSRLFELWISPYTLTNFLFLGDNTSSASGDIVLGRVQLNSNLSAVPEPSSFLSMACLGVLTLLARSRIRIARRV